MSYSLKLNYMASVFNKTNNLYENPKRNTFDHSFQNNLTLNFGQLVPCFVKECLPGDSFKIDPTISINMMPMLFPVQTRIRAHIHFFYVTNRSIYKDWMDFIGNTKDNLEIPYISYSKDKIYTGSLYDYMGLPTTSIGQKFLKKRIRYSQPLLTYDAPHENGISKTYITPDGNTNGYMSLFIPSNPYFNSVQGRNGLDDDKVSSIMELLSGKTSEIKELETIEWPRTYSLENGNRWGHYEVVRTNEDRHTITISKPIDINSYVTAQGSQDARVFIYVPYFYNEDSKFNYDGQPIIPLISSSYSTLPDETVVAIRYRNNETGDIKIAYAPIDSYVDGQEEEVYYGINSEFMIGSDEVQNLLYDGKISIIDFLFITFPITFIDGENAEFHLRLPFVDSSTTKLQSEFSSTLAIEVVNNSPKPFDISDEVINNDVYSQLQINALPFRAYESIYNSFYRQSNNNPLIVNGEPVYNQYLPFDPLGGEDDFNYKIHTHNWEDDFLTTAVQSPQQGVAPLVGITANGEISFKDSESGEIYSAKLNSNDGDHIDSFTVTSPNMPTGNLRQLVDFSTAGISISDLRGVNALQRWLEINMRRGLRYKDQIMSHFGVDVRYDELLMPEFIGGMTEEVYVNRVNQTVETSDNPLGWQAGQGGAFGSSKHSINHYCQEHGYIIGILFITPVANYSQLLPKHFLKRQLLDYFFPEFGHLGMQPIQYNEVCPIEAVNNSVPLTDTFGYNRAWYDYLGSVDEVHGLFRTSLRNFVISRKFSGVPELSPEFLTINHNELDDVFATISSDDSHKFLGQVYFDCQIKRPIPEYGIPKLEV